MRMHNLPCYLQVAVVFLSFSVLPACPGADDSKSEVGIAEARQEYARGNCQKAAEILEQGLKSGASNAAIAGLLLGLAYERLGDEDKMVTAWQRVARIPPANTLFHIMDASNTRNHAYKLLSNYFHAKGDWVSERHFLLAWHPSSWCGTCDDKMKDLRMSKLLAACFKLNDVSGAASIYLSNATVDGERLSPKHARLAFELYKNAGQLDDLARIICLMEDELLQRFEAATGHSEQMGDERHRSLPTFPLVEMLRIHRLEQNGDFRSLIGELEPPDEHFDDSTIEKAAAAALSRCGARSVRATREALIRSRDGQGRWFLLALQANPSPAAKSAVARLPSRI